MNDGQSKGRGFLSLLFGNRYGHHMHRNIITLTHIWSYLRKVFLKFSSSLISVLELLPLFLFGPSFKPRAKEWFPFHAEYVLLVSVFPSAWGTSDFLTQFASACKMDSSCKD